MEVTRNTPTLVQLYCAFLVLNMLITQQLRDWGAGNNPLTPFVWVVIVVSLHKGVFHAEALRAGIEAVPATTLEAARSLGFSQRQLLVRVQLPLAVRFALPSLTNNLVDLVKMTAVASAIAVGDVTYESIMIWSQRDNVLELLLLILLWFGLMTSSKVPAPVLARLNAEVNKALQSPDLREKMAQQFYDPIGGTPERFAQAIRADMDRYGRAIKEAGIKPE